MTREEATATALRLAAELRASRSTVSGAGAPWPFPLDTPWRAAGMDSLDLLELVTCVEDELTVTIPDSDVVRMHTLADLVGWLAR